MKSDFKSPFLNVERILENDVGFVIFDSFPVSKGHCLIVPHRVFPNYFDATAAEFEGLQALLLKAREIIQEEFSPDGFNIGVNCGSVAGQTVPHVHIHLIPRYKGDMDDPRGGVRGVIPDKQKY